MSKTDRAETYIAEIKFLKARQRERADAVQEFLRQLAKDAEYVNLPISSASALFKLAGVFRLRPDGELLGEES